MGSAGNSYNIIDIWKSTLKLAVKDRFLVATPYICLAIFNACVLAVLFLVPRYPVSIVLAPIISAFWGEQYLHYPANFLILPALYTKAAYISGLFAGTFFTGAAVSLTAQSYLGKDALWWTAIGQTLKRYLRLVVVWGLTIACYILAMRVFRLADPILQSPRLIMAKNLSVIVFVQMLFVYAIPSIIVENKKVFDALKRTLAMVKNFPVTSVLLVGVPMIFTLPAIYLQAKVPVLMYRFFPEITLLVLGFRIITIAIISLIITVSAVVLLLKQRERESRRPC